MFCLCSVSPNRTEALKDQRLWLFCELRPGLS